MEGQHAVWNKSSGQASFTHCYETLYVPDDDSELKRERERERELQSEIIVNYSSLRVDYTSEFKNLQQNSLAL